MDAMQAALDRQTERDERERKLMLAEQGPEPYEPGPYTGDEPDWDGFCSDGDDG